MRVLFVHFSDLFYPSGTAVIYRRVLPRLTTRHEIFHLFGTFQSMPDDPAALRARYAREACGIVPVDLGGGRILRRYGVVMRGLTGRDLLAPAWWFYAWRIRRFLRRCRPDLLWWSADYLHSSLKTLFHLRHHLGDRTRLHLSIYDAPGFWEPSATTQGYYAHALREASSFDVIGENLRAQLLGQLNEPKPVRVMNDFVDAIPHGDFPAGPLAAYPLRVVITGHIVGAVELRQLLAQLNVASARAGGHPAELRWYGSAANHLVGKALEFPSGVTWQALGSVPREQIIHVIADAHFGYLNMPFDHPEFSEFSVPTKLITYLEAGLPVAFHAPEFSEVHQLNETFGFGVNLSAVADPAAALGDLAARRADFQAGARRLIAARYDPTIVLREAERIVAGD